MTFEFRFVFIPKTIRLWEQIGFCTHRVPVWIVKRMLFLVSCQSPVIWIAHSFQSAKDAATVPTIPQKDKSCSYRIFIRVSLTSSLKNPLNDSCGKTRRWKNCTMLSLKISVHRKHVNHFKSKEQRATNETTFIWDCAKWIPAVGDVRQYACRARRQIESYKMKMKKTVKS